MTVVAETSTALRAFLQREDEIMPSSEGSTLFLLLSFKK